MGNSHILLVGMSIGTVTMENNVEDPQQIKNKLPYDPPILLLGIYQENKNASLKRYLPLCSLQHYLL